MFLQVVAAAVFVWSAAMIVTIVVRSRAATQAITPLGGGMRTVRNAALAFIPFWLGVMCLSVSWAFRHASPAFGLVLVKSATGLIVLSGVWLAVDLYREQQRPSRMNRS